MYEDLERQLREAEKSHNEIINRMQEEAERYEIRIREIKEQMKRIQEESMKSEETQKIPAVQSDEEHVYFVPKRDESDLERKMVVSSDSEEDENEQEEIETLEINHVYMPSKRHKEKKKQGFMGFIKRLFGLEKKKNEVKETEHVYFVPDNIDREESVSTDRVYLPSHSEEISQSENKNHSEIIEYAIKLRKDKDKHKELFNNYINALKKNDLALSSKFKNALFDSKNKIALGESFLRSKLKEIRLSDLSFDEKTQLINYICEVAKMKEREKPEHLKEIEKGKEEPEESLEEELNRRKERILSSKHFTVIQKKNMIREIDDELLELSKKNNSEKAK